MHLAELILVLLAVAAAMGALADRLAIPHPVLLVAGGALLGFIPGLSRLTLSPEAVFVLFVPPLIYRAATMTSLRDFRVALPPIAFLSIVMVLATMCAVAVAAHALIPTLPWPAAFALGAVVSPPDTVAAIAVTRRLHVPRSIITVLQGEGLVNDATALVAYRIAVAAVVTGAFSFQESIQAFVVDGVGGAVVGTAVGWSIVAVRRRLKDLPTVENCVSLLTPFAAYIPADQLGWSGVLAVVAVGFYLGKWIPSHTPSATRLQSEAMWDMIVFVLESLVFILVGLELPVVMEVLRHDSLPLISAQGVAISAVVIAVRLLLVFPRDYLVHWGSRWYRRAHHSHPWRHTLLVGWVGMRGGESLIIALSLPFTTSSGAPFPERDLIIFLTFSVIVATLVLQGMTLRWLVHKLGLSGDEAASREEASARARMAQAALLRLSTLHANGHVSPAQLAFLEEHYQRQAAMENASEIADADGTETSARDHSRARLDLIEAERRTLLRMREQGEIGQEVMRRMLRRLDLETSLLDKSSRFASRGRSKRLSDP